MYYAHNCHNWKQDEQSHGWNLSKGPSCIRVRLYEENTKLTY